MSFEILSGCSMNVPDFDTNDDGLLSSADVQLLLEYAFQKDRSIAIQH